MSSRIGVSNENLFPVDADHRSICKIPSRDSQEYEAIGFWITVLVKLTLKAGPAASSGSSMQEFANWLNLSF